MRTVEPLKDRELPSPEWSHEEIRRGGVVTHIVIRHPQNGYVTIDIERRRFHAGDTQIGPVVSISDDGYCGRGWRDRLWTDAVQYLVGVYDTKGQP